jgi:Cu/Ag efflux protein CusF
LRKKRCGEQNADRENRRCAVDSERRRLRPGEATKINPEPGSVELKHEDMPGFTPAMKMEFYVRDKAMLKDLKAGDRVRFALGYKNSTETITSISKAP